MVQTGISWNIYNVQVGTVFSSVLNNLLPCEQSTSIFFFTCVDTKAQGSKGLTQVSSYSRDVETQGRIQVVWYRSVCFDGLCYWAKILDSVRDEVNS